MPQKTLLLLFVAVLSLFVGWGMGKILTLKRTMPSPEVSESEKEVAEEETGNEEEEELPSDWESYTGTITPLDASIYMQGSHKLVDENGEIALLLEARDDKLEVASGMEAEVQGPVEKTVEGNQRIMTVEKIVFR